MNKGKAQKLIDALGLMRESKDRLSVPVRLWSTVLDMSIEEPAIFSLAAMAGMDACEFYRMLPQKIDFGREV